MTARIPLLPDDLAYALTELGDLMAYHELPPWTVMENDGYVLAISLPETAWSAWMFALKVTKVEKRELAYMTRLQATTETNGGVPVLLSTNDHGRQGVA